MPKTRKCKAQVGLPRVLLYLQCSTKGSSAKRKKKNARKLNLVDFIF